MTSAKTTSSYFLTLDIETSTRFSAVKVGRETKNMPSLVWLAYGFCNLYRANGEKIKAFYFREWKELEKFLDFVSSKICGKKVYCFVHNLSFEFDFLIKNISKPIKILSNSTHSVIACTLDRFPFIEFRCTYQISGCSLKKVGELVNLPKLDSDYRTIYPWVSVTEEERAYCERDNDIVAEYVVKILERDFGPLKNIPYTKTGIVRKKFNELYTATGPHSWDLMPPEDCYPAMLRAFQGAITISNPIFTGVRIKKINSFDETSAYPYAMLKEVYPMNIKRLENFSQTENKNHNFWIAKIRFNNISSKFPWCWLSISKMDDWDMETGTYFNGKLVSARYIERTITSVDFETIKKTYNFTDYQILEFYVCNEVNPIPTPYVLTLQHFATIKHDLKKQKKKMERVGLSGTPEFLEVCKKYGQAKSDFNAIYGMTVQKLTTPEYEINEVFEWVEKPTEYKRTNKHMHRNFLIGTFVTAYARQNLINAILTNCPYTFVYADTDSIKYICPDKTKFIDTNEPLSSELRKIEAFADLGTFDWEGEYEDFITFGAKKYAYVKDGKTCSVVAGLPTHRIIEGKMVPMLESLDGFYLGRTFEDCKNGKRYISPNGSYTKEEEEDLGTDYTEGPTDQDILTGGGVALFPVSYQLSITRIDEQIIKNYRRNFELWLKKIGMKVGMNLTELCRPVPVSMSFME